MDSNFESMGHMIATLLDGVRPFIAILSGFGIIYVAFWTLSRVGFLSLASRILGFVDERIIVGLFSFVAGTRWRHRTLRWAQFTLVSALIATALAIVPLLYTSCALVAGLMLILGVLREWSHREHAWEEDQNHGELVDLRFQAVVAAALLFLFVPMWLSRLDAAYHLFPDPKGSLLVDTIRIWVGKAGGFAAYELPHSVPIVHAVAPEGNPFRDGGREGIEWIAALLRLGYELLAVGAFIDVLRIAQRIAASKDLRELKAALELGDDYQQGRAIGTLIYLAQHKKRRDAADLLIDASAARMANGQARSILVRRDSAYGLYRAAVLHEWRGELFAAAERLEDVARDCDRAIDSALWAWMQNNLGNVLQSLGELEGGESGKAYLLRAVEAYEKVLEVSTRASAPFNWALTQNNLGNALQGLGDVEGGESGKAYLQRSVEAYEEALEVLTRAGTPTKWALTQNNLGNALQRLGDVEGGESGKAYLLRSVEAYENALEIRTRAGSPADWAMTQNNLGSALQSLGELEGGKNGKIYLLKSVETHEKALEVRTRSSSPIDWAVTHSNLGAVLYCLGRLEGGESGKAYLLRSVDSCKRALEVLTRSGAPTTWARTQHNLGKVLQCFGELEGGESGKAYLLRSVDAYGKALEVRTRAGSPADWATTQNNLGDALRTLGDLEGGESLKAYLLRSVDAYEKALEIYISNGDKALAEQVQKKLAEVRERLNPLPTD